MRKGEVVSDTIGDETCLFLKGLHLAEQAIADRLIERASGPPPWPEIDLDKALPWVESRTGKTLSASQREAVKLVLASKVAVMTGGPGVGKTTLLDTILRILIAKGVQVALAAPTGRAAKRMTEQTGIEAKTIHRLLEIDPKHGGFSRNEDNPLDCDLLVVDETSMVDVPLMNALTKAIPPHAGLLLVGDVDQLPSVGPGQVLADIIASERMPVARLTEVFRQAAESRIVVNAHRINNGQMPEPPKAGEESDFYFVEIAEPEEGVPKIIEMVKKRIPRRFGLDPMKDVQVLCPMNRGVLGARNLNIELQAVLNPNPPATVERFGWRFSPGDRVMETQNDYDREVFNGDLGTVVRIDEEEGALVTSFDGREVSTRLANSTPWCLPLRRRSTKPGLGVSGCGHPGRDAALHHAGAQPALHGRDPRQAAGGARRAEEGCRHCGPRRADEAALDQAAGVAVCGMTRTSATPTVGVFSQRIIASTPVRLDRAGAKGVRMRQSCISLWNSSASRSMRFSLTGTYRSSALRVSSSRPIWPSDDAFLPSRCHRQPRPRCSLHSARGSSRVLQHLECHLFRCSPHFDHHWD